MFPFYSDVRFFCRGGRRPIPSPTLQQTYVAEVPVHPLPVEARVRDAPVAHRFLYGCSSVEERWFWEPGVAGSNPAIRTIRSYSQDLDLKGERRPPGPRFPTFSTCENEGWPGCQHGSETCFRGARIAQRSSKPSVVGASPTENTPTQQSPGQAMPHGIQEGFSHTIQTTNDQTMQARPIQIFQQPFRPGGFAKSFQIAISRAGRHP